MRVWDCFSRLDRDRNDAASKFSSFCGCKVPDKVHSHCEEPDEIGLRSNPSIPVPGEVCDFAAFKM
jgi:hypothetical protein